MSAPSRVAVVGGGAVGLCTALALRRAGASVTLIEREIGGENASYGNAGVVTPWGVTPLSLPGVWRAIPRWLLDPLGPVALRPGHALRFLPWALRFLANGREPTVRRISDAMRALNHDCIELYRGLLADAGAPHLLRDSCYVVATRNPDGARLDTLDIALKRGHGARIERVDGPALRALEPALSPDYKAAVVIHGQARALSPGGVTAALRRKLVEDGGVVLQAEALALRPRAEGGWTVETDAGPQEADRVALTAGVWSARLLAPLGVKVPLQSERGYHVMFRDPGVTVTNSLMDADRRFVASSMEDGLRAAGTAEFGPIDAMPSSRRADAVARGVCEMLPDLDPSRRRDWSGQRPSLPDSLPVIGPVPGHVGLFAGFGHAHWGFMMAPRTGRLLCDLALDRRLNIDLAPYRADRFV